MEVWREPVRGGHMDPRFFGYAGLEMMRQALRVRGPRPPISHLCGILFEEVDATQAVFTMPASGWFLSSQEHISAGTLMILADAALGSAVQIGVPAATPFTTAELSMTFLAPCAAGGLLRATGTPLHDGRPLALSQCWVEDGAGQPVAHGTSSCFLLPALEGIERPNDDPVYEEPAYDTPDPHARPVAGATVSWDEWRTMPGLEILRRQIAGDLPHPPIHHLTGMTLREASQGRARFTLPATQWLTNPLGTIQGGALAMLGHAALATAVTSTLEAGTAYRPIDVKVNFLRPAFPDGAELVAEGVVTHRGKTLAVATADVVGADGRKIVTATGSTMILAERMVPPSEG